MCRRSKVISSRRRDQIADGAASATMAWVLGRSPEVAVVVAQLRAAAESDPAAIGQGGAGKGEGTEMRGRRV